MQAGRGSLLFTELTRLAKDGGNIPLEVKLVIPWNPGGHVVHAKAGLGGVLFTKYAEVFAYAKGAIAMDPFDNK